MELDAYLEQNRMKEMIVKSNQQMDEKYNSKYKPMILGPGFQSEPDVSKWFHYSVLDGAGGRI